MDRGFLLSVGVVVLLVFALRAAQSIAAPVLLAGLLAVMVWPGVRWLQRRRVPPTAAVLGCTMGVMCILALATTLVGASLNDFSRRVPNYRIRILALFNNALKSLGPIGGQLSDLELFDYVDPGAAMGLVGNMLSGLGGALTNTLLIFFTMIFLLLEASGFPAKLRAAFGASSELRTHVDSVFQSVNHYIALKTVTSLATGLAAGIFVAVLRIDYPFLWGLLAFLLNYVPNIGSILAAVPPVLLALVLFGPGRAVAAIVGYLAINVVVSNMIEPRLLGKGLGLSTLVVFLSLVFWGWVLGPVGMLLAVPLTMTMKIALGSSNETRWVAILLGPPPRS